MSKSNYISGTRSLLTEKNRFYSKILFPNENGCMIWNGLLTPSGYGLISVNRKNYSAHRYSYEINVGEIPNGMFVLHKCDVRNCVAPDHLFIGTQKDNMVDMSNKNRAYMKKGEDHPNAILKDKDVLEIKKMLLDGEPQKLIAKSFNVAQSLISVIAKGDRRGAITSDDRNTLISMYKKRKKENGRKKRKLSSEQVNEIRSLLLKGVPCTQIYKKYSVCRSVIQNIKLKKYYID